jgi:tetratricopeptide (TPR) repeat protein
MMRLVGFALVMSAALAFAAPDPLAGFPQREIGQDDAPPLPAVPAFELPIPAPGTHGVRELLVVGKPLLGTEAKVSGYVLWIYDCVAAVQRRGESRAKVQQRVDDDPTLCERKKLYLGDTATTPLEQGLWVVDVPRPPNKLEKERLPKDELKAWPKVPALKVGDYVTITGTFSVSSPHSERNSDGLLVWAGYVAAKPPKTVTMAQVAALPHALVIAPVPKRQATTPAVPPAAVEASNRKLLSGMTLYAQKKYADAIAELEEAVKSWPENTRALFGLGMVHSSRGAWSEAVQAFGRGRTIASTDPMFVMMEGIATYEAALDKARQDQAQRENRTPAEVTVDVNAIDQRPAEGLLARAVSTDDKLWRAHYYLGRIARDGGRPADAAAELTKACARSATVAGPWVALVELYRKWQRPDLAIEVAMIGTRVVLSADAADLWYVLGLAYDDKRMDANALDALTKAIAVRPDHVKARFQRGQIYFRMGNRARAIADLEEFANSGPGNDFAKQQAANMLMDLAAMKK